MWPDLLHPDYTTSFLFHPIEDAAFTVLGLFLAALLFSGRKTVVHVGPKRGPDGKFVKRAPR